MAFETMPAFCDSSSLSSDDARGGLFAGVTRWILFGPSIRPGPPIPSVFPMSIGCLPLHDPSKLGLRSVPRSLASPRRHNFYRRSLTFPALFFDLANGFPEVCLDPLERSNYNRRRRQRSDWLCRS